MNNKQMPKDPMMCLSVVNTYLRDKYHSLEALVDDLQIDQSELIDQLAAIDYVYDKTLNKFV